MLHSLGRKNIEEFVLNVSINICKDNILAFGIEFYYKTEIST